RSSDSGIGSGTLEALSDASASAIRKEKRRWKLMKMKMNEVTLGPQCCVPVSFRPHPCFDIGYKNGQNREFLCQEPHAQKCNSASISTNLS
ncbi:unnamed protein product, partial [Soboliphyme baturini]|uniref:Ovule protein n=1 Tax=Soboliphyme baturini TaxID=241478 RepID=A0A183J9H0_9BILA